MSVILEDLGTASDLQKRTKAMLDRASVRPISIPRERKGEAITLVNRALWHRALSAMESMKTLAAVSLLVSDTLKHAEQRRYPSDLAWLATFGHDDLSTFFEAYAAAVLNAIAGTHPWEVVDALIEHWRLRAIPQDETLHDRDEGESEDLGGDLPRVVSATEIAPNTPYVASSHAADDRNECEPKPRDDDSPRAISEIDTPPSTSCAATSPTADDGADLTTGAFQAAHTGDNATLRTTAASAGEVVDSQPPSKRSRRKRTSGDIAASHILDAAWPVMQKYRRPKLTIDVQPWRARNKAAALELHEANNTPQDVVDLLQIAYRPKAAPHFRALTSLRDLVKWAPQLRSIAERRSSGKNQLSSSSLQPRQ